jgi:hypothetical protein
MAKIPGPWFPHMANARRRREVMLMMDDFGNEGYGIYWQLLEILREEETNRWPMDDIKILCKPLDASENKLSAIVGCYGLFEIDSDGQFGSPDLDRLLADLNSKQQTGPAARKALPKPPVVPQVFFLVCSDQESGEEFVCIGMTTTGLSRRLSGKDKMPYAWRLYTALYFDENNQGWSQVLQWSQSRSQDGSDDPIWRVASVAICDRYKDFKQKPKKYFKGGGNCFSTSILNHLESDLEKLFGPALPVLSRSHPVATPYYNKKDNIIKENNNIGRPDTPPIDALIAHWNAQESLPHCRYLSPSLPQVKAVGERLEHFTKEEAQEAISALGRNYQKIPYKYRPKSFHSFILNSIDRFTPDQTPDEQFKEIGEEGEEGIIEYELNEIDRLVAAKIFRGSEE